MPSRIGKTAGSSAAVEDAYAAVVAADEAAYRCAITLATA
jgi:hypothetical protein